MTGQHTPLRNFGTQCGISLLELLVGITISMLTVLVITQVFLASEKQRRIPAAGANTQVNGILALDALQRDVRQAGYGLSGGPWVGACTTGNLSEAGTVGLANLLLAPVAITQGSGSTPSDSIDILSSGKVNAALQIKLEENRASGAGVFVVPSTLAIEAGDWLIVSSTAGAQCDAFQAQSLATSMPWGVTPSGSVLTNYNAGSLLTNMGATPIRRRWSVSDTFRLRMTNLAVTGTPTPAATDDVYADIVLMRAFYAKDTDGNGTVDTYNVTPPASRADWSQVIGLRLAVVVRSPQWDKEEVTTNALQWNFGSALVADAAACADDASSQCLPLGLTHVGTDTEWKHYRYRMYESLIPLRNLLWNAG